MRGEITLALAGHGCGNHGVATGRCRYYPQRVLWIAQRLTAYRAGAAAARGAEHLSGGPWLAAP